MGLSQEQFWRMTPVEFRREAKGYEKRRREEYRLGLFTAWQTANYTQSAIVCAFTGKRLPPLSRVLSHYDRATSPMPKTLPVAQLNALSEHLGIAFRPISPEAKAAMERLRARG